MIFCLYINSFGQVGIGTSTPEPGSVLHIESSDKGVLIPRVQLSGIHDILTVPVTASDEGTIIYNLEDSGQPIDKVYKDTYYVWNGTVWEDISPLTFSRDFIHDNNVSTIIFMGRPASTVTANASASYTAWTDATFANESLDSQNMYNGGVFTIPADGLYAFAGGISITRSTASGDNKYFGARITLNGIEVASSMFGTTAGGDGGFMPLYWNALLNAGDVVRVQYRMRDSTASGTFTLNVISNISVIQNSN